MYGNGAVAQMVEQWTENPCVTGSIPVSTTLNNASRFFRGGIVRMSPVMLGTEKQSHYF